MTWMIVQNASSAVATPLATQPAVCECHSSLNRSLANIPGYIFLMAHSSRIFHFSACSRRAMPTIACASNFQRSSAGALRLGNTELQTQLSNIEFCSPEVETRSLEALEEAIAQPASLTRAIYSTAQPVRAARSAGGGGRSGPIPAISSLVSRAPFHSFSFL